jgi:hypothetical protein
MAPHFDGADRLLPVIFPCFLEPGVNRHAKRWAIRLIKRERTLGFNKSKELLCFLTDKQSAFEGRHKAMELIQGTSESIIAFL